LTRVASKAISISSYAAARVARLAGGPLLGDLPEANELAKRLLRDEIIPAVAADDATHVGLESRRMVPCRS